MPAQGQAGNILSGGAQGSRLLQAYDTEEYREQNQEDREEMSQERIAHDRALEDIQQQRATIAKMQTDAKIAQQALINKAAENQAKDIIGATKELGTLQPEKASYSPNLAAIRAKYPAAFIPAKNGATGTVVDFVKHLDAQNEEFTKSWNQQKEQATIFEREHGVKVPIGDDGQFDFETAQKSLDARMNQPAPPSMSEAEETRSSTGTITKRFTPTEKPETAATKGTLASLQGNLAGLDAADEYMKKTGKTSMVIDGREVTQDQIPIQRAQFQKQLDALSPAPQSTQQAQGVLSNQNINEDQQAEEWAKQHPDDPRAEKILQFAKPKDRQ